MKFQYRYYGSSQVSQQGNLTAMSFVPDTLRAPTYFEGVLNQHIPFRAAMSALHQVVTADARYQPKDKSAYHAWLQEQQGELADKLQQEAELNATLAAVRQELRQLRQNWYGQLKHFYHAKQRYFSYLSRHDPKLRWVYDPIITVHPDRVLFEVFSQDESSYGVLSCSHNMFDHVGEMACGTTNVDYSADLYQEFQKIRSYQTTRLSIDPSGFQVQTAQDDGFIEQKIDVPESWLRSLLQVSSAMNLATTRLELHPMDVFNFCSVLRRQKERTSPRAMRFVLTPNQPVRVIFEPWNIELTCPRSVYQGEQTQEIRIWGRRRLLLLEQLIPVAQRVTVHLLGTGLPSFWIVELAEMQFTLGLSGWISNNWSQSAQFNLLAPRNEVSELAQTLVWQALSQRWFASVAQLCTDTQLDTATVNSVLGLYLQAGRVMYDLAHGVYRLRELSREPLPLAQLRYSSPQEEQALRLLGQHAVTLEQHQALPDGAIQLHGSVKSVGKTFKTSLTLNPDQGIQHARCQCAHYTSHRLRRGPCAHMLAVRLLLR